MTPIPEFVPSLVLDSLRSTMAKYGLILWIAIVGALALGFRSISPNERLGKIEAVNVQQDSVLAILHTQMLTTDKKLDQIIALACVRVTQRELTLAQVQCVQTAVHP